MVRLERLGPGHQGTRELGGGRLAQGTGHQGTRELGGGMLAQGTGIWYWKNGNLDREAGQAALPPVGSPCFLAVSYHSFSLFESQSLRFSDNLCTFHLYESRDPTGQ